jgi:uncharacterized protein YndB with AHSA1/START domain
MTQTGNTTTDPTSSTTVHASIEVAAPRERAYEVFTRDFGAFKPSTHSILQAPLADTVVEPYVGGHIIDRGTDGSECPWATVLVVEPPERFVFSWDISPSWELVTDRARTSEVHVTFTAVDENTTRVDLEHRHLERHGAGWDSVRDAVSHGEGWPLYLDRYAALFTG